MTNLVWIDTETSGLSPEYDFLLEVCLAVTTSDLEILASHTCLLQHRIAVSQIKEMSSATVVEMHTLSGLWEQIPERGIPAVEAEESLLTFISKYVEAGKAPMCGSTVGFDRSFLRVWMPRLEKYFHYRNIDVSTVKELTRLWNEPAFITCPDEMKKAHRAFADIQASIKELRHYRRTFLRIK
jgi:oligoribonuclease